MSKRKGKFKLVGVYPFDDAKTANHLARKQSPSSAERQAVFCLGQMDMQASVCDMLRAMANGAAEGIRSGLILAADLVESMEVNHADS